MLFEGIDDDTLEKAAAFLSAALAVIEDELAERARLSEIEEKNRHA